MNIRRGIEPDSGIRGKRMSELKPESVAAVVSGKAMPVDIFTGESLTKYFARKYLDMQAQRDMFRSAEISWEQAMMDAIGEDGVGSVGRAIAELKEQRDALAAENAALARHFSASAGAVENWNSWADAEDKLAAAPETPATDAYLNSLRADGVDSFGTWLRQSANIFDENGRHEWADKNRVAADKAKEFAVQLREGEPS